MRSPVPVLLALLAALLVAATPAVASVVVSPAVAAPAAAAPDVRLSGVLSSCVKAKDSSGGSAVFRGVMPLMPGMVRMAMRFDLQQATSDRGPYTTLAVPKWGDWQQADVGVPGFVYKKTVVGLTGPARYRAQIRFRWFDANGKIVATAKRVTAACRQPDLRPNLTVTGLTGVAGVASLPSLPGAPGGTAPAAAPAPALATYRVAVRNTGRGAAGAFGVTIGAVGMVPERGQVTGLAARASTVVEIVGAACLPGSTVDVDVDPESVVAESDESDNTLSVACPLPG